VGTVIRDDTRPTSADHDPTVAGDGYHTDNIWYDLSRSMLRRSASHRSRSKRYGRALRQRCVTPSLRYQLSHRLLSVPAALLYRDTSKDAEALVMRHENAVLRPASWRAGPATKRWTMVCRST